MTCSRHNLSSTLLSDGGPAGSCERTSILLTINNQVVDGLVHRLQVFHIVELYQERQPLILVQIIERRLSRHSEAFSKSMHRSCKEWYLILAHILTFFDLQKYDIFPIQPNNNSKMSFSNQ